MHFCLHYTVSQKTFNTQAKSFCCCLQLCFHFMLSAKSNVTLLNLLSDLLLVCVGG